MCRCPLCTISPARVTKPSTLHVIGSRYYGPDRNSHPYLNLYPTLVASVVAFFAFVSVLLIFLAQVLGDGVRARRLRLHAVDASPCVNKVRLLYKWLLRVMVPGRPQAVCLSRQRCEGRVARLQGNRRIARAEPRLVEVVRIGGQRRPRLDL